MLRVSLNTSNMIASERPLVNRLTCPSLGCINAAVPSAGAGKTGDKNRAILHANSILNVKKNICIFGNYHLLDLRVLSPLFSLSSIYDYILLFASKSPGATFCYFCSQFFLFLLDST